MHCSKKAFLFDHGVGANQQSPDREPLPIVIASLREIEVDQ
jgi:hypothetical protein